MYTINCVKCISNVIETREMEDSGNVNNIKRLYFIFAFWLKAMHKPVATTYNNNNGPCWSGQNLPGYSKI